ncbi:MAG: DUF1634 domain-containing protein [Candidatus Bathyarchaeota archaeon]
MPRNFRDKMALSGITVLMLGVFLLIFTFISAYGFLTEGLSIIASSDLVQTFGEALAPLIATCIRIMYLGVMGWIGSLLTIRGVTIIAHAPKISKVVHTKRMAKEVVPQKAKTEVSKQKPKAIEPKQEPTREDVEKKEEPKPHEPEIIVVPPDTAPQQQPEQPQRQENSPPNQQSYH